MYNQVTVELEIPWKQKFHNKITSIKCGNKISH